MIKELLDGAKALRACRKTDGIDTLDKLVALYKSPQGREFCAKYNYPSREQWNKIAKHWSKDELRRHGIFINEPSLQVVYNPETAVAVNTHLYATFNGADKAHRIIALHGANVTVRAKNYAVFAIESDDSAITNITKDDTCVRL